MSIAYDSRTQAFHLKNARVSYIFRLAGGKYPIHVYWGRRVRNITDELIERRTAWTDETFSLNEASLDYLPQECPTFAVDMREGMIHLVHENGTSALLPEYVSHEVVDGKPSLGELPGARGEGAQTLLLHSAITHSAITTRWSLWPDNVSSQA